MMGEVREAVRREVGCGRYVALCRVVLQTAINHTFELQLQLFLTGSAAEL